MDQATYVDGFHDRDAVVKMKYSPLGNTGLVVSRLAFGGVPLGGVYGPQGEDEGVSTVHRALRAGVNYIDTAPLYGNGHSEKILGKALATVPRKSYYIATKVGCYMATAERTFDFSAERVFKSIDRSLELLGLDYVDVIQAHEVEFAENLEVILKETLPALAEVVKIGKARFIGITGYQLSFLKEVVLNSPVKVDLILTYARHTLIDQTLQEYLPFFKEGGIAVLNACSVAMGILTESPVRPWHPATMEIKDACRRAVEYCKAAGGDLARVAIYYSLETPGIAAHLTGSCTLKILDRNLETYTSEPTELDKRLAREIKQKFFDGLSQKHWEGIEKLKIQQKLKELRGKIPEGGNDQPVV
ncbi:uncharacterized protein LOC143039708 [Oratosquilla oratoria]|uniref:uncharacterized protein LOC143039708 n=1 Tax=Oratosquilla oratoria TaxID=337810 RepID=UPI003F775B9D